MMAYIPTVWVDNNPPAINQANLNKMEHGIDIAQGDVMVLRGLTANRPASVAELEGRLYFATDAPYEISRDNGAGWDVVGYTSDLFTALGALQVGSGAGAAAPLGIGAAGEVLTVAGGTAVWAAAAGGGTWNLIAETILGAPAATVTFAAIPGTYRILAPYYLARGDGVADNDSIYVRCNADSGNNYAWVRLAAWGGGSSGAENLADAKIELGQLTDAQSSDANIFSYGYQFWYNYASATMYKHVLSHQFGSRDFDIVSRSQIWYVWGQWENTANAITSLTYFPAVSANFIAGTRFALYGIT